MLRSPAGVGGSDGTHLEAGDIATEVDNCRYPSDPHGGDDIEADEGDISSGMDVLEGVGGVYEFAELASPGHRIGLNLHSFSPGVWRHFMLLISAFR